MVLSNELAVLTPEDALVASNQTLPMTDADADTIAREMQKMQVPVPIAIVRSHLSEYEDDAIRRLLMRYSGDDVIPKGWKAGPHSNGIQVSYGSVEGNDWYTMRTTGKLPVSAEKAARLLMPCEMTPKFDDMTKEVRLIEKLSDSTEARLVFCNSVMFTSPRGLCVTSTVRHLPDGRYVIATRSVEHPNDQQPGHVRALSWISGYVFTPDPADPKTCEIAVIAHMDLGGNLPAVVLRFLGLAAPIKMVKKIQEVVAAAE